jgi:hypothetical protein
MRLRSRFNFTHHLAGAVALAALAACSKGGIEQFDAGPDGGYYGDCASAPNCSGTYSGSPFPFQPCEESGGVDDTSAGTWAFFVDGQPSQTSLLLVGQAVVTRVTGEPRSGRFTFSDSDGGVLAASVLDGGGFTFTPSGYCCKYFADPRRPCDFHGRLQAPLYLPDGGGASDGGPFLVDMTF